MGTSDLGLSYVRMHWAMEVSYPRTRSMRFLAVLLDSELGRIEPARLGDLIRVKDPSRCLTFVVINE